MIYRGRVENGTVVLDEGIRLPDGTEVTIEPVEPAQEHQDGRTLYQRLEPFVGSAKGLPPDASKNVDHYLYGHPKKE